MQLAKPVRRAEFRAYILNMLIPEIDGTMLARNNPAASPVVIATGPTGETEADRLMLAEDNVVNQTVVLHPLAKLGFRADLAAAGLEATRLVVETFSDRARRRACPVAGRPGIDPIQHASTPSSSLR